MPTKTLVATALALAAVLAPLGGWTLLTVSSSSARISVLEEAKVDLKERLKGMDDKLDQVLEEQRQVRADLWRSRPRALPSDSVLDSPVPAPAPRRSQAP